MRNRTAILICAVLTAYFSAAYIPILPEMLPFLRSDVRAAAPRALDTLRRNGLWLVNTHLVRIVPRDDEVCFIWDHQYSSKEKVLLSEALVTCE